ncbi:MAG: DUF4124 domain-containing protein [Pseudomonadota bacterium]
MPYALLILLLLSGPVRAEIYKCVTAGKTTYSDRPCDAAAEPATLPPLNTIQRKKADDLAKSYDERLSRDKAARDQADAEFVKNHVRKAARDKAVRTAIINHQAIKGMTPGEVESALGSAEEKLPDGSWRYRRDGQRITVQFEEGEVSGVSVKTEKTKGKYSP